jgi:hypothetical protein
VLIAHDGTLDLRPEDEVAAAQGKPSNRDASLASLAIKLALVVIAQQLSSPIVELWADALARIVGLSLLQRLAQRATQPRRRLIVQIGTVKPTCFGPSPRKAESQWKPEK